MSPAPGVANRSRPKAPGPHSLGDVLVDPFDARGTAVAMNGQGMVNVVPNDGGRVGAVPADNYRSEIAEPHAGSNVTRAGKAGVVNVTDKVESAGGVVVRVHAASGGIHCSPPAAGQCALTRHV